MAMDTTAVDDITRRRLACWVPPLIVVASAACIYVLRSAATVECNIGINAGIAMLTALIVLPGWLGAPDGYPSDSPTCADNVPSWWPGWLPT